MTTTRETKTGGSLPDREGRKKGAGGQKEKQKESATVDEQIDKERECVNRGACPVILADVRDAAGMEGEFTC